MSIHSAWRCSSLFALPTVVTSGWRPGVERGVQEEPPSTPAGPSTSYRLATTAPPRREVRVARHRRAGRARPARGVGGVVRPHVARPLGERRVAHRWAGRSSALGYVAAVVYVAWGSTPRRRRCCWCWRRAGGSRATSARRSARSASCAGSGSTGRGASPGWRTTRPPQRIRRPRRRPTRLAERHPVRRRVVRLPGTRPAGAARRRPRAARGRGGGRRRGERRRQDDAGEAARPDVRADQRPDPGRRRPTWRRSERRRLAVAPGGRLPGLLPLRAAAPSSRSASATCRASTTERAVGAAVGRAGADDVVRRLEAGLETQLGPTWPGGVDLSYGQWQKVALARGFMRDGAAAARARRAHRRAGRRDRARAVRAVTPRRPGTGRARAGSRCWSRTASPRCGWPT